MVAAEDRDALGSALAEAQLQFAPVGSGFRVNSEPVEVGRLAAHRQLVLTDLRTADGNLENLFLELTSGTQRDTFGGQA